MFSMHCNVLLTVLIISCISVFFYLGLPHLLDLIGRVRRPRNSSGETREEQLKRYDPSHPSEENEMIGFLILVKSRFDRLMHITFEEVTLLIVQQDDERKL
ncbi:hypothetical protein DINM_002437 [Dirofilaria immitis]|nr:hypothetical protein [Dirofilaria immitis]